MMRRALCSCLALASGLAAQARPASFVEPSSPYQRAGVQHATCRGRILDHEGEPLGGARVILWGYQPFYGALPLAEGSSRRTRRSRYRS